MECLPAQLPPGKILMDFLCSLPLSLSLYMLSLFLVSQFSLDPSLYQGFLLRREGHLLHPGGLQSRLLHPGWLRRGELLLCLLCPWRSSALSPLHWWTPALSALPWRSSAPSAPLWQSAFWLWWSSVPSWWFAAQSALSWWSSVPPILPDLSLVPALPATPWLSVPWHVQFILLFRLCSTTLLHCTIWGHLVAAPWGVGGLALLVIATLWSPSVFY